MLVRSKSVSITTRLRAQLRTINKFKSVHRKTQLMHTLRAVVSHGASDGIVDDHHTQAVVTVVAGRTHLAGPLPQIVLVPAAWA